MRVAWPWSWPTPALDRASTPTSTRSPPSTSRRRPGHGHRDVAATAGATASIEIGDQTGGTTTPLPQIAGFSSRGPALANDSDVLKPDITAPGVSVLAAVAPPSNSGRSFDLYSGTSMASPHIAGLAAFMLGEHPGWSPMSSSRP